MWCLLFLADGLSGLKIASELSFLDLVFKAAMNYVAKRTSIADEMLGAWLVALPDEVVQDRKSVV